MNNNIPSISDLAQNPSCMDDYDPNAMPVDTARKTIRQYLNAVHETEIMSLKEALGRVLATHIVSPCNVPNHNNSAMDGYAFQFSASKLPLKVLGVAFAGKAFLGKVSANNCVKIMTGAVIPQGTDTVIMQEHVTVDGENIIFNQLPKLGDNVRLAGEDLQFGQTVLSQGHVLNPADLGLIASLGIDKVSVYRKLKVAFFSTGDELVNLGNTLKDGQIYDSNRYTLHGMLTRLGVEIIDMGVVADNPKLLKKNLLEAASLADVIITTGGVSVGEADHMKALLAQHGEVLFWKIAMKPGRPLAYGKIHAPQKSVDYFGLPGNPVSSMVTFYQFVREALLVLMGNHPKPIPLLNAVCTSPIKKITGRTEFQRGILALADDGEWKVAPISAQGSGILRSMSEANCFIVLDETTGNLATGSVVKVQLLAGII